MSSNSSGLTLIRSEDIPDMPPLVQAAERPKSADAGEAPGDILFDRDFIVAYQAMDQALCQSVIDRFDQDVQKSLGNIFTPEASGVYDQNIKSSWDLEIPRDGAWAGIFQRIHSGIQRCMQDYLSRSPILQSVELQVTGYKIQMYPKNQGYFRWHADAVGKNSQGRAVAMILYLNDVEKGGETEFFHQRMKVVPKAGQLIFFPASWNYMHCGHTPESGDKYIIQTFIRIKN